MTSNKKLLYVIFIYIHVCSGWKNFTTLVEATTYEKRLLFYLIQWGVLPAAASTKTCCCARYRPNLFKDLPVFEKKMCVRAHEEQISFRLVLHHYSSFSLFSSSHLLRWQTGIELLPSHPIMSSLTILQLTFLSPSTHFHISCVYLTHIHTKVKFVPCENA